MTPGRADLATEFGPRTVELLSDMLGFAAIAERLVNRGKEQWDADEALPLAAEAVVLKLGEAVARLPPAFVHRHGHLRLRAVKGMRDLVAHEYGSVDSEILWEAMAVSLPALASAITHLLAPSASASDQSVVETP
ncbi:DUF86 domain-containing protein [Nakamurella silvestris]|nr:DUF86 domain-containing protein [Nakamurella silvestris]